MNKLFVFLLVFSFFVASCTSTKPVVTTPPPVETRKLDDLVVKAKKIEKKPENITIPVYHGSRTLDNDLIHTKLDVHFDIPAQELLGKATLTLKPVFYQVNTLTLDAKGFTFAQVRMNNAQGKKLKYQYDGAQIHIDLGRYFSRKETYKIYLDYVAHPTEGPKGGSAAIQSDQGLYFVDPDGSDPDKPTQIWTQGETESNSKWCPTIDTPNERATHEIAMTVDDKYETLSNGTLERSVKNTDGTRTDYWNMDIPTAPYLMMMAVGDYAVVRDTWNGKPIAYYVEPQYKDYATDIFPHTKELLSFYSNILGVDFPWQKYDQIVVRDFVSGAMENTTAVVFQEFVNGTKRELMDQTRNEVIVAHEMFHHWFGDYVTCESWANTTLNEGFANYGEYLWLEHKYGKDEADQHLLEELMGYLDDHPYHPLIDYHYGNREDMFDAHSYNKGGCTLHMLRNLVGDDAFFASLKRYLTTNALTAVELDELRMAFEDELGMDMHWFFDQWYDHAGNPELEVAHSYDASAKKLTVTIEQTQKGDDIPEVFLLPLKLDVYDNKGHATRHSIEMNRRKQSFEITVDAEPAVVELDPDGYLVGTIDYLDRSELAWKELYQFMPSYRSRIKAVKHLLRPLREKGQLKGFAKSLLKDPFHEIRETGLYALEGQNLDVETLATIEKMALSDSSTKVRANALKILSETGDTKYVPMMKKILADTTIAYTVTGAALSAISKLAPDQAAAALKPLENIENQSILASVGEIYANDPSLEHLAFFEKNLTKIQGFEAVDFYGNYIITVLKVAPNNLSQAFKKLKIIATDMKQAPERRFAATKILAEFRSQAQDHPLAETVTEYLKEIKQKETLKELQSIYQQMF
ncbi:MAG TPA: alanyl aminopeptidase [Saprospiraceae bacterium]|nr:alanyl aminopeptidase [Saprospiraceae bacterium]